MTKIVLLLIFIVYLLTGCVAFNKSQSPVSIYDFGMQHVQTTKQLLQQSPQHRKSLLIADATAPSWLDNNAIHYRLLYQNPTQSYTYASSRWIAAPAALLTQQIRNRIVASTSGHVIKDNSTAKADYVLHIELEEFTQLFDTTDASHIVIGLRASLVERNTRKLLAQKDLSITGKTLTADAVGAVSALSSASNRLIDELVDWLTAELSNVRP
ncbi:MAG: ABC-type transport auxiliary lipoprotein family protein [Nitrosomonas sp.]|nr:ABC-type transport auxiliary lipoprotein family protein [Nitrosomonas sp.]